MDQTKPQTSPPPVPSFSPYEQSQITQQQKLPLTSPNITGTEAFDKAPQGTTVEDLLKPTKDVAGEPYVHFGNLSVQRELVDDFKAAQAYLAKDPEAVDALYALENGKQPLTVDKINDGNDNFNAGRSRIQWDPKSALLNADGSKQTPALGLLHEQGHALEYARDPTLFASQVGVANQRYDTGEEQRNITGLEDRALKYLPGEGGRADHGGIAYVSKGPTSTELTPAPALDAAGIRDAIHGERFGLAMHGYTAPPPPGAAADAIKPWDHSAQTGSVLHLDDNTVAQYVGRGQYQTYDVAKDLHGVMPPENDPNLRIDAQGRVAPATPQQVQSNDQTPTAGGR